jgi:hypothetical protein
VWVMAVNPDGPLKVPTVGNMGPGTLIGKTGRSAQAIAMAPRMKNPAAATVAGFFFLSL